MNTIKTAPPMSGEQKTFEDSVKEYMIKQGVHDRPDITEHDFRQGWIACEREQSAALKAALAELIKISSIVAKEDIHGLRKGQVIAAIDRARKLLNKQPQSESDGDKNL